MRPNTSHRTPKDKYGDDVAFRLRLDFRNLIRLIQDDRRFVKAVAAGSVPPEMTDVWKQLEREGNQTEIIDRSKTGGAEHGLPDVKPQWEMLLTQLHFITVVRRCC